MGLGTQSIGVPDLGLDKIGGVLMAIPPLREQERIAELLNILATNVRAELRLLRKLNCLKSGLMTDLLTGRVRVPESLSAVETQR
jgi:type I restriction enzyme S subunit